MTKALRAPNEGRVGAATVEDAERLQRYFLRESMTAARGFKQSFENLLARIGEHPKLVPVAFRKRGIGGVRLRLVPGFENYIVFYTIRKDEARVLRVTHGAQDWQSMMGVSLTPDEEDA